jgi:phospholipase C
MGNNGTGEANDYDFIVSRSSDSDNYSVWRFDLGSDQLLTKMRVNADATLDRTHQIAAVGKYLLEWGPLQLAEYSPCFPYRLFEFDPASTDLFSGQPVLSGAWPKQKFWGRRVDFGNPDGGKSAYDDTKNLVLVPTPNFVLTLIQTPGRGTFQLWSFDPDPGTGSSDPLPQAQSPQGAFETIDLGHQLLSMGNFVLDWLPRTGEYCLWSFDPQNEMVLARPAIQQGRWDSIDSSHQLVVIGDHVLDWVPDTRMYRVWWFDPNQADPLTGPVASGQLPDDFTTTTTLVGVQPPIPVNEANADRPGTIDFLRSKVKHVVYYMLENRSFDHVCGWLYENHKGSINFIGGDAPFDGASLDFHNADPTDPDHSPVHLSKYADGKMGNDVLLEFLFQDPYHDNSDVMRQMFFRDDDAYASRSTPNMGGFVWNNGIPQVMQTYSPEQLPVLTGLAREYAVSDAWFCSMPGGTDVNRAFALTGSALQHLNNFQNGSEYVYWPDAVHRPSIWKVLWSNGIEDWKIYNSVQWQTFVFTYHLFLQGQIPKVDANPSAFIGSNDQFKAQAAAGTLPAFSFLEPIWIAMTGTSSYHPGGDLVPGERALNEIYEALSNGPGWDDTVLVITFDEHGGIFDHVPPPYAVNPWPNDENDGFHYDLMGPRVPTIVVSPRIDENTVFRSGGPVAYDATSILATLLEWFGIPRPRWGMGERTRLAPTFEGVVQRVEPRTKPPAFTPPHDTQFPNHDAPTNPVRLHDLHRLMIPRVVWALSNGKLSPAEAKARSDEILSKATDLAAAHRMLEQLEFSLK